MAKTKQQKVDLLASFEDKIGKTAVVVFTHFDGLNVKDTSELRKVLREAGVEYTVAKKSLLRLALKKAGYEVGDVDKLVGGLGIAFGYGDAVAPAKLLQTFSRTHPALKLVGGLFEGSFIDAAKVKELASLPTRDELLSKLVWLVQYPTSGFVNALAGNLKNFLYVLTAIGKAKA